MKQTVTYVTITVHHEGQRLDNFLINHLKGVPKSHIYRIIRGGEVRINKGRVQPTHRLRLGDKIRIPPIRLAEKKEIDLPEEASNQLKESIIYEDEDVIVINKPAGISVHGGTGQDFGVIEAMRIITENPFLELVHRIDRETSGCLIMAKTKKVLQNLHILFRELHVDKTYYALLEGHLEDTIVTDPIDGKASETHFTVEKRLKNKTLVKASPKTGRKHQIRIHAANLGHPIVGDEKYGAKYCHTLYLHAYGISFPWNKDGFAIECPYPDSWKFI